MRIERSNGVPARKKYGELYRQALTIREGGQPIRVPFEEEKPCVRAYEAFRQWAMRTGNTHLRAAKRGTDLYVERV